MTCILGTASYSTISTAQSSIDELLSETMPSEKKVVFLVEQRIQQRPRARARVQSIFKAVELQLEMLTVEVAIRWEDAAPSIYRATEVVASSGVIAVFWCDLDTEDVHYFFSQETASIVRHVAGMNPETVAMVLRGAVHALLPDDSWGSVSASKYDQPGSEMFPDSAYDKSTAYSAKPNESPHMAGPSNSMTESEDNNHYTPMVASGRDFYPENGAVIMQLAFTVSALKTIKRPVGGLHVGIAARIYPSFFVGLSYAIDREFIHNGTVQLRTAADAQLIRVRLQSQYLGLTAILRKSVERVDVRTYMGIRWVYTVHRMDSGSILINEAPMDTVWQFALLPGVQIGFRPQERTVIFFAIEARVFVSRAEYAIQTFYGTLDAFVPWVIQPVGRVGISVDFD